MTTDSGKKPVEEFVEWPEGVEKPTKHFFKPDTCANCERLEGELKIQDDANDILTRKVKELEAEAKVMGDTIYRLSR